MSSRAFELGFGNTEHEITVDSLQVDGKLPDWLTGTLVRNGPGALSVGEQRYRHWFDGLAMLHKFSFSQGTVAYANRFLRGNTYQTAMEAGKITYSEFATDPCRSLFARIMAVFSPQPTDNAKVSIGKVADRYLALCETPIQVEFDPETLETVGVFSYESGSAGEMTTAHPHFDGNAAYNVVTRFSRVSQYRVYRAEGPGKPTRMSAISVKQPSYMHSFGMSQNYAIITEFPLVVNPLRLLLWLKPFIENYRWKPERGTPFWVINRHTGEVVGQFDSDPFFSFHHVNAFEHDDNLFVDAVCYPDASIVNQYYLNRLADQQQTIPQGELRRYRIDLKNRKHVTYEVLSDAGIELPRFDYAEYNMNGSYRYVYGIGVDNSIPAEFYNQIVKIDVQARDYANWSEADCYPGEPVFIATPNRKSEDDGILLSVVLDANRRQSYLLVLDAASLDEIARAYVPHPVLFGYHGEFFQHQ